MSKKNSDRRGDSIRWISRHSIVPKDGLSERLVIAPRQPAKVSSNSNQKSNKK
ncbi:hypothetical protein COTS27_01320 [Spirochaetota bacterium]|nr:hypothetical protein COTS27_01320 [Spirochaetota bacterium]